MTCQRETFVFPCLTLLSIVISRFIHAAAGGIISFYVYAIVVQLLSHVQLFMKWTAACQASLSFTISLSLLKLLSIETVMLSNHLILCCLLLFLLSIFPSISVFSNESFLCISNIAMIIVPTLQ